ncbi:hypothetical protein S7711_02699 [Stachybotrys chartarum IBT 7711]|uniref:Uncharacterized protein n=1 Tax=Stachybotrys chartarum (strain CBS 109288 / IBT 7711) TaxID=1280523 RepID=A0A084AZ12_STACB|nr:hypothetical protein S7711_02699 [Stachybotrys chartarum IBT 7711]KFA54383.1 hypothetical protein S40293_04322 [Stachybotrys chartarum IBT 40293]KFA79810.1 hypothetical protein S40288_00757 [Stachybotrys chartarum IBT 40288]
MTLRWLLATFGVQDAEDSLRSRPSPREAERDGDDIPDINRPVIHPRSLSDSTLFTITTISSRRHQPSMAPKASADAAAAAAHYYLVPNLQALDPSACEVDLNAHAWVQPTIIEDDDLTFGGKSLSAWYEEERRRLSCGASSDEERRGRERVRRYRQTSKGSHKK